MQEKLISPEKDKRVGYGKYATKLLIWLAKNNKEYFRDIKVLYYPKYNTVKKKYYDSLYVKYIANVQSLQLSKRKRYGKGYLAAEKRTCLNIFLSNERKSIRNAFISSKKAIKEVYPHISDGILVEYHNEAKSILKREFEIERELLIDLHILRYEELFDKAMNPDLTQIHPKYHDMIMTESLSAAADLLSQKEKILGMHTAGFKVQVNNFLQQKKKKRFEIINIELMSFEDQVEMLKIIESIKIDTIINRPIQDADVQEAQVIKTDKLLIEAPIQKAKHTDKLQSKRDAFEEQERNDLVPRKSGKTLLDVQFSMQSLVQKQLEDAMKKNKKK